MDSKLNQLTEKIELLITKLEKLQAENKQLKEENQSLISQMNSHKTNFESLKLRSSDDNEKVKTKLTTILNRLDQLEELAS